MSIQPEYRRLGTSGLRVSVPILGTMGMGDLEWNNWVLPEDKSIALLKAAWDAGITTLDTANMYSNGVSESIIGKFPVFSTERRCASASYQEDLPRSALQELELIAYCHYKGIGVTAYAPLMDGHLARPIGTETTRSKKYSSIKSEKPRLESDLKIIQRVQELSERKNWKMSQVALAWLLSKNSIPIVGANSTERLHEAIVVGKTLTNEEIKYLEELYEHRPVRF
ncbi:putative aryl-alcohol dehydrogenase [Lentinula boryana]|uniref:Aryl-alcohol dehydrogenase n=1 Tax=Lentinula boryana TaxID=40481 RepID=A0ABQ8QPK5_9AGAR|nr:putative aryl-alcohol dehydrogenase [Lentinula boryana]